MSDAISKAIDSIRELMDLVDTPDRALFLRGLNAIDALQALKSGKPDTKTHINLCQKNAEPVAAIKGWFHGECVVQALDPAAVLPAGMALYAAPQPVVPVLPTMQKAFVTAESGNGKYCLVFKFRTLGDLHEAHNEWVTQPVSQPVVPEGYVLVPVEPTPEMLSAGLDVALSSSVHGRGGWGRYLDALYKTMLSAGKGGGL